MCGILGFARSILPQGVREKGGDYECSVATEPRMRVGGLAQSSCLVAGVWNGMKIRAVRDVGCNTDYVFHGPVGFWA